MDITPEARLEATEVYVWPFGLYVLKIPPYNEYPHATTLPSFFSAANAVPPLE
jgi:hypothetical protein